MFYFSRGPEEGHGFRGVPDEAPWGSTTHRVMSRRFPARISGSLKRKGQGRTQGRGQISSVAQ